MIAVGWQAVFATIQTTPGANPVNVVRDIRALLPGLEANLPAGLNTTVRYDSSIFITASIQEVLTTIVEATLIVLVVIFLFLGSVRSVVIPIVTIPLSLVGIGIALLALGFSINLLTLLAMALAIGLVVDDAIVVVENIQRHIERGLTPFQASIKGTREIAGPVISMTITLAAVYTPIALLGGLTGTLFREFALTLAGAVLVSGIIALTLSPMMCSRILLPASETSSMAKWLNRRFASLQDGYSRLLNASLNDRPLTFIFVVMVLPMIGFLFFANAERTRPGRRLGCDLRPVYRPLGRQHRLYSDDCPSNRECIPDARDRHHLRRGGFRQPPEQRLRRRHSKAVE